MGNYCCPEKRVKRERVALLLVGLDNAGKTVTAKGLAGERPNSPVPTVGFSVIELKYGQYDVKIFDLGGGPNIRGIWHKYFVDIHGVIFVIDSCDTERFMEVKEVLEEILSNEKVQGKPLLVLANKQDQETALDEIDIIECLQIEDLANKYKCPTLVQSCSANESNFNRIDQGIKEGYEWIMNYTSKNYNDLNSRVQLDMIDQEIKEKQELIEKIKRIRAEQELIRKAHDPDAIETYSEYVSKLNGNANKNLEVEDLYPNPEESLSNSNSNTSDSSISFPAIFHINGMSDRERPRSAVQIISQQLKMNDNLRRSQSAKTRRNKTAPVKFYDAKEIIPSSAKQANHRVTLVKPRDLKSADDGIFSISSKLNSNVGPGGDHYAPSFSREVFNMDVNKLPPLKVRSKVQAVKNQGELNGVTIVDIE